jgi:hypothetical protein
MILGRVLSVEGHLTLAKTKEKLLEDWASASTATGLFTTESNFKLGGRWLISEDFKLDPAPIDQNK